MGRPASWSAQPRASLRDTAPLPARQALVVGSLIRLPKLLNRVRHPEKATGGLRREILKQALLVPVDFLCAPFALLLLASLLRLPYFWPLLVSKKNRPLPMPKPGASRAPKPPSWRTVVGSEMLQLLLDVLGLLALLLCVCTLYRLPCVCTDVASLRRKRREARARMSMPPSAGCFTPPANGGVKNTPPANGGMLVREVFYAHALLLLPDLLTLPFLLVVLVCPAALRCTHARSCHLAVVGCIARGTKRLDCSTHRLLGLTHAARPRLCRTPTTGRTTARTARDRRASSRAR